MGEYKTIISRETTLNNLLQEKYDIEFYQRNYVWTQKQLEDLINDLSRDFLRHYNSEHALSSVKSYDPYFMGEIIISTSGARNEIVDGQQRITTFTLLLMYLLNNFSHLKSFPDRLDTLIYGVDYGEKKFNLDIEERNNCMHSLLENGYYNLNGEDSESVINITERYEDIKECWNEKIDESNVAHFTYWLRDKVYFSKVETNNNDFAYVIFETMNDRGLPLTQIEMIRSYLLSKVNDNKKNVYRDRLDKLFSDLKEIKLSSRSKAEFEFIKILLRGHYATDFSSNKNSDFSMIGNQFHRWLRENPHKANLNEKVPESYEKFIDELLWYGKVYIKINKIISDRLTNQYLFMVSNSDYGFTLQPALLLSSIKYEDSDEVVHNKFVYVSKFLSLLLTLRVWNHAHISQSSLEDTIYSLASQIRGKSLHEIKIILKEFIDDLLKEKTLTFDSSTPMLNQQNKRKIRVLLALITEHVTKSSLDNSIYNTVQGYEVEHIWADHFDEHLDEFTQENDFNVTRNNIGDLLLLPKKDNQSYGDLPYQKKLVHYIKQNLLCQSLHNLTYDRNPGFVKFNKEAELGFKSYENFTKKSIFERASLYKDVLKNLYNDLLKSENSLRD